MYSSALQRLTEKKGKQLSKFLGIDSVPSTRLIATMQSRINNPIFKLSMTDYEAMCGNKIIFTGAISRIHCSNLRNCYVAFVDKKQGILCHIRKQMNIEITHRLNNLVVCYEVWLTVLCW